MTEQAHPDRGVAVLEAARARHAAMSPERRALADVGADALRLVVVATTHELAARAMDGAWVPREAWRQAHDPESLRGHAPGTPLLWLSDPLSVDGPGRTPEMRAIVATKDFVPVQLDDVAAILGER